MIDALEIRRGGVKAWTPDIEEKLTGAATQFLHTAHAQFAELADDRAYWSFVEQVALTVALPRYLRLAQKQHELELAGYGLWRNGDLVSRAAYALAGLVAAAVIWRTAIPDWLEPLPLSLFIGGPLLPDLQIWFSKKRFRASIAQLVHDMHNEATRQQHYHPLFINPPEAEETARQLSKKESA